MAGERPPQPIVPGPADAAIAFWRWLRRMRTALGLLGALGVAVFLGTIVPQRPNVPDTVARWLDGSAGPAAGLLGRDLGLAAARTLDVFGLYDVFGAPWFLLLLALLFTSLTACLVPRIRAFLRMARHGRPPLARDLDGKAHVATVVTDRPADAALAEARAVLAGARYRLRDAGEEERRGVATRSDPREVVVAAPADDPPDEDSPAAHARAADGGRRQRRADVAGEKGHLAREGGSLVFHLAFYVLLVGVVLGELTTFVGQVAVVEGESFTDTPVAYWTSDPGRFWYPEQHTAFTLTLDRFDVAWTGDTAQPVRFVSTVTVDPGEGRTPRTEDVLVNVPMVVNGMKVHLLDWGYAVRMVVRDGGEVVHDAFIPLRAIGGAVWSGVAKAPAAQPQLGLQLDFFPSAPAGADGRPVPTGRPEADAPLVLVQGWQGDLRLDQVQNVFELDTAAMAQVATVALRPGGSVELPGGATVEFPEFRRWAGFQVSRRPTAPLLLAAAALILTGLLPALYAHRRRVWLRADVDASGRTVVTVAGHAFQRPHAFAEEFPSIVTRIRDRVGATLTPPADPRGERERQAAPEGKMVPR